MITVNSIIRLYLTLLWAGVLGWWWIHMLALGGTTDQHVDWVYLLGVITLYLSSHVFRMLRLVLLTLDERDKAFPIILAHCFTAFPSSLLPFKIGEILRLGAFFYVYSGRSKAVGVWLAERFGDVLVIAIFIFCLYLFNVNVPPAMRVIFILFVFVTVLGIVGMFTVTKIFGYLNRHLVLTSHSPRGLRLLRAGYSLRTLEQDIYRSVDGRLSGFLLLSVLIWVVEILALALFLNKIQIDRPEFTTLFASSLLANLPVWAEHRANDFGVYQSYGLTVMTLAVLTLVWLLPNFKLLRD